MSYKSVFAASLLAFAIALASMVVAGCNRGDAAPEVAEPTRYEAPQRMGTAEVGAWDADGDGRIDENEFRSGLLSRDMNADGRLDRNEFGEGNFDAWDADADGYLDEGEFNELYSRWDTDQDGILDDDEVML